METKLLDTKQAAEFLGISPAFLERDRWLGASIAFVRIGNGKGVIRYRLEDLEGYVKSRRVRVLDGGPGRGRGR